MKVLYVVGSCLTRNTSANMSHNGYVQGLLENGCEVDILMAKSSWGKEDKGLPQWKEATYYVYESDSFIDRLRRKFSHANRAIQSSTNVSSANTVVVDKKKVSFKKFIRNFIKKLSYCVFPLDPLYPLDKVWLNRAISFKGKKHYDLIVSNSSPAASHKMVEKLIVKGRVSYTRWIQIWEDPWYFDIYGYHCEAVKNEEHRLLQVASEVYYVSPLTLYYQKELFPDCAEKLKYIPLPALKYEAKVEKASGDNICSFGYFGDYFSVTRNLRPFYDALVRAGYNGFIYGDTDLELTSTEKIEVRGRVTLEELSVVQGQTDILVHLCNRRGGQIPGKIYHYSATCKPILFILDGTPQEVEILEEHFKKYNRYYFTNNTVESIQTCMKKIETDLSIKKFEVVGDFLPVNVVGKIL